MDKAQGLKLILLVGWILFFYFSNRNLYEIRGLVDCQFLLVTILMTPFIIWWIFF